MNVFKIAITACVITSALLTNSASAVWSYPVSKPIKPSLTNTKYLQDPTVQEIQDAIAPKTQIKITGTVDASGGHRISVEDNDVRLNFSQAQIINWSGSDTWSGFIEVSGQRVEILNMKMKVVSGGKCRGVVIHTPASDVRFANCTFENIADGMIADAQWQRLSLENTKFLNCGDWSSTSMEGGYGLFLEDDDSQDDHIRLVNVTVTLANSSGQHALRIAKVQRLLIQDSFFGANAKRAMWAYGVDYMTIKGTTFDKGNVLFNLKTNEWQTERATRYVRMEDCRIDHRSILTPLSIYCGKGSRYMRFRNIDITSTTSDKAMEIGWRGNPDNRKIEWVDGSMTFNGQTLHGYDSCAANDWNDQELAELKIGPMS